MHLFVIAVEVLSRKLHKTYRNFFHRRCEHFRLNNVCFADDLMIFGNGDKRSFSFVMESYGKTQERWKRLVFLLRLNLTSLLVRYLGLSLISSWVSYRDCKVLIECIMVKVHSWSNRRLSYARWLQLIRSVLQSFHLYWLGSFLMPM